MGTFLVTRKMSPELAARVERSVTGARRDGRASSSRRIGVALARACAIGAVLAAVVVFAGARYQQRRALEDARAELLEAIRAQSGALGPDEVRFMERVEPWLTALAGAYEGDMVADELRAPKGVEAAFARPSVYVRGPVGAFAGSAAVAEAAAASTKDALALCLVDPPATRAESAVLAKVRAGFAGNALVAERTAQTRRLQDVIAGVRASQAPWAERARAAEALDEIARVRRELAKSPIEDAKRAARAELLIAAMDEADEAGPTELDGERPHQIRIGVYDLRERRPILRLRRHVDPSWLSPNARAAYARPGDGCALAFDVRAAAAREGDAAPRASRGTGK